MKVTCLQRELSRGLGILNRMRPASATVKEAFPVTGHVLVAAESSRLKLVATNLEVAITCWIGAQVQEEGAFTMPARLLTSIIKLLPNERVEMVRDVPARSVKLRCARFEARISGMEAEEFPSIPRTSEGITTRVVPEALKLAINQVVFAAATEDSRPVLTGIDSVFEGNQLTLAAVDGFRLAVHRLPLASPVAEKVSVIIPSRSLAELGRLLGEEKEPVEITVSPAQSQVLFRLSSLEMVSKLLLNTFPNWSKHIPGSHTTRATVGVAEFLRATRIASLFAKDDSGIVRIRITPGAELTVGKMALSAWAEETGEDLGEIDAQVEGEPAKIAFNSRYLLGVLRVMRTEKVNIEVTTSSNPALFKPEGVDNYTYVLMPVSVQW